MFKKNNKAIVSAVATALTLGAAATQAGERYIITSQDSQFAPMSAEQAAPLMKQVQALSGAVIKRDLLDTNGFVSAELSPEAVKALVASGKFQVEKDPQRHLLAESTPYGITMTQSNQVAEANGGSVKVCITDTGYDLGHEDLPSNSVTGDDNDGNGNDTGNWYNDGHGHGTHVSGTIAAIGGNNLGVVGVNPGNNISLHMVKLFNDSGSWAYGSDLVAAINQCVSSGAKVMSMSIGGPQFSSAEESAFQTAYNNGMLLIAAAGNDGNSADSYPASYGSVMSVAAVDSSENRASYSQYPAAVEIAAPGSGVNSTLPGNSYASWNGTSMATPHVAGVASLVWAHYPQCTNAQIRNAINMTAKDKGAAGRDQYYGYGIVQAKDMFDALGTQGCDVTGGGGGGGTEPPAEDGVLENGVAQSVSGAQGEEVRFTFTVPAGATDVAINMSGGSGDGDLYVKKGSAPTTSSYDCRPYKSGNNESCTGSGEGVYHVMVRGYSAFSGASLVGTFTEDNGGGGAVGGGSTITDISVNRRKWKRYTIEVPAGMSTLDIDISGGTGDADLYVTYGQQSSTSSYDCRPYKSGNNEACSFSNPAAGTWHIDIRGYSSASGVTLNAYYNP